MQNQNPFFNPNFVPGFNGVHMGATPQQVFNNMFNPIPGQKLPQAQAFVNPVPGQNSGQTNPWGQPQPGFFNPGVNPFEEAKKFSEEAKGSFTGNINEDISSIQKKAIEGQIRSALGYFLNTFSYKQPFPQILSINGFKIEGLSDRLKNFDKETIGFVLNSLGAYQNYAIQNLKAKKNIQSSLKEISDQMLEDIQQQEKEIESFKVEMEKILAVREGENTSPEKEEALKSLESLDASLRDLDMVDEEVDKKLELIRAALK